MDTLTNKEEQICMKVMSRIAHRRLISIRVEATIYGFFLISAIVGVATSIQYLIYRASATGFTEYISLIISDGSHLSGSWNALALSLVESAPLMGIILTLITLTGVTYFAKKIASNGKLVQHTLQSII